MAMPKQSEAMLKQSGNPALDDLYNQLEDIKILMTQHLEVNKQVLSALRSIEAQIPGDLSKRSRG